MSLRLSILPALLSLSLLASTGQAEDAVKHTNYTIALAGLPLANAHFQTRKDGQRYSIDAQIASTGVGEFLADTKAEMLSAGAVSDGQLKPDEFRFRYKYGKRVRSFETRFEDGNVVSTIAEPAHKKRKGWVEVRPEDLKPVTDPVAGLILPVSTDPCRSVIAVYDGEARLDLKLERKGEQKFATEGFRGDAVVCSIRYEPKSGYRRGHRDVDYVRKLKTMEIWFAKAATLRVYAPVFLSIPTKYGTLTVTATRFDG